jgi:hypothetical protein
MGSAEPLQTLLHGMFPRHVDIDGGCLWDSFWIRYRVVAHHKEGCGGSGKGLAFLDKVGE